MNAFRSILFALCLLVFSVGAASAATPDEEAISRLMQQDLASAWKENSPGKVLEVFTESVPVVWLDADKGTPPATSKAARKKELEELFNKVRIVDFVMSDLVVTKISDTLALVTCTEKITIEDKTTKEQDQLLARTVYEVIKEKDKWHAYREISFAADSMN